MADESDELTQDAVEGGNYEVLRRRLHAAAGALEEGARGLNAQREARFGTVPFEVLGQERVRTEINAVPVDLVQLGGLLLVGYDARLGLKQQTEVGDVFGVYEVEAAEDGARHLRPTRDPQRTAFLRDERFLREFREVFQYYATARLIQLRVRQGRLLAVFQVGATVDDVRVLRWDLPPDGQPIYLDNRGERDHVFPPTHDFRWTDTTGRDHVLGRHPHVNVLDTVFVETVGGDLTIKVEDSTETGEGVYAEPVDDPDQSLDDAEIAYARRGPLILLRIKPYAEETVRHLVFNTHTRGVVRLDAIGQSCVSLPDDHGILFPGGFHLADGEHKVFDAERDGMVFERAIPAPNGEDVLYVFVRRREGLYALYPYNLVRKEVRAPIHAHGWSLFDDGSLIVFRAQGDPARVHPVQVWRTPFVSAEEAEAQRGGDDLLSRVGNQDLVRGVSDALTVVRLARRDDPARALYEELVGACERYRDAYFWASDASVGDLSARVDAVRVTAERMLDEYEKVEALRKRAREVVAEARDEHQRLLDTLRIERLVAVEHFLEALTALRRHRGHLVTLADVRFVDRATLASLGAEAAERTERVSRAAVAFLEQDDAFRPVLDGLDQLEVDLGAVSRAVDLEPLHARLDATSEGVDLLAETIAGLEVDDPTRKTAILDRLGEVFGTANRVRAALASRTASLQAAEGEAAFTAQLKLLGQSVQSSLGRCDTPEACDDALARLLLQLEDLEARFGEFDAFLPKLAEQREEIDTAFATRKQRLVEARERKAQARMDAAERILGGLARRAARFDDEDALNTFFASDTMVEKVRALADELEALGETVRAEDLRTRVLRTRQDARRGLRDKLELFDEADLVQLGRHKFAVNRRPIELSMVVQDEGVALTVSGTDFRMPVDDPSLEGTEAWRGRALVSESASVCRAEYLAYTLLQDAEAGRGLTVGALEDAVLQEERLLELVRAESARRYDEGYDRGVHDVDAAKILAALVGLRSASGLLRFSAVARALAVLFWGFAPEVPREAWQARARALVRLRLATGSDRGAAGFLDEVGRALRGFHAHAGYLPEDALVQVEAAAAYLVEALGSGDGRLVIGGAAGALVASLDRWLQDHGGRFAFEDDLRPLADRPVERFDVLRAYLASQVEGGDGPTEDDALEAAAWKVAERKVDADVLAAEGATVVEGLLGRHSRIDDGRLPLRLSSFLDRLGRFVRVDVPGYRRWRTVRHDLLERWRRWLRLDELVPKVMSTFVRNKLIQDVYLPMIGDNLAKQMGAAGGSKRTDRMGLLLLVSPPGYGKTTLMEYVAHRLGLVFVKVNGPALGHGVTSLDPSEAPNATARQEVDKINLALELGNNVLLYLDDIQHTHPELLQKFISLCDASRRIEGVWQGRTRTYDLRGKTFAVVMAGNPYTESGERFQVPDMLANRADTWNLGDVLEGREEAFALSFVENALTSNPVLRPLADRAQADVYAFVRMAQGEELPPSALEHDYTAVERADVLQVLRHLFRCRDVLLKVNAEYVRSAAMEASFRTEPRFQLQGSYRNMAKLAEKVVPAMSEAEVEALIGDHYRGEAQTLTTGAEFNLLRLGELRGTLDATGAERLAAIREEYRRLQLVGGADDDPAARVTGALSGLGQKLDGLRDPAVPEALGRLEERLGALLSALDGVGRGDEVSGALVDLGARLDGLQEAVRDGASGGAGWKAVVRALRGIHERLGEAAVDLDPLVTALQAGGAPAQVPRADGGPDLREVLAELRALRTSRTQDEATAPAIPRDAALDESVQRHRLLQQAQRALNSDLRRVDSGGDATLAAALSVVEMLTVHMVAAARARLPDGDHDAFLHELRRSVATAVSDLASRR